MVKGLEREYTLAPSEVGVLRKVKKFTKHTVLQRDTIKKKRRRAGSREMRKVDRKGLCGGKYGSHSQWPKKRQWHQQTEKMMEERRGAARSIDGKVYIMRGPDNRRQSRSDDINGQEKEGGA